MQQTTGIQTGQDDTTATPPATLNPSSKGATFAKKLSATLNRFTRQPLVICSGTKVPITFHVSSNPLTAKSAITNSKTSCFTAPKGPSIAKPVTKPITISNPATIFAAPNNNNIGLANLFKGKLPITAEPSITQTIITSQPIPTISATIKRPAIFSLPAPVTVSPPKRYTSPLKRPANTNNAKNLVSPCQCQCKKTKHLVNAQTNTGSCQKNNFIGIVINDNKNRKRSIVGADEGPPNKKIQDEDGEICPVCLESCTNSGDHRLVALKCGHLFGANCIETWLRGNKKCPTCQRRAILPDLRNIYARKLAGPDPVGKPGVRSIGVRAVRRSRRRRRYQVVNSQSTNQDSNEALSLYQQCCYQAK